MPENLRDTIRQWYILGIAICLIGGGAILASLDSQPAPAAAPASASADAPGRQVFRKCQACHSLEPGKNILGPPLAGIIGRKAGSDPSYNDSPALKQANLVWDAATLDKYLADPEKVVP